MTLGIKMLSISLTESLAGCREHPNGGPFRDYWMGQPDSDDQAYLLLGFEHPMGDHCPFGFMFSDFAEWRDAFRPNPNLSTLSMLPAHYDEHFDLSSNEGWDTLVPFNGGAKTS